MAISRAKKEEILNDLIEKFKQAKSVVFVKNSGLSVKDISDLRKLLPDKNVIMKIAKKNLVKIAAEKQGITDLSDDIMDGPVATIFSLDDEVAAASTLAKFAKKNEHIELMGGIIEGSVIDRQKIKFLANLPSKEQLIGQIMSLLQCPVIGFCGTLQAIPRGFMQVLAGYREKSQ